MGERQIAHDLASQFLAALRTLKDCVDRCPDAEWQESHGDYPFSQVAFHAVFDCDFCLSETRDDFMRQAFHRENARAFGDYEELGDGPRTRTYERDFVEAYYGHCVGKAEAMAAAKTNGAMLKEKGDIYMTMTALERYVNAIRHIQHHAAQLALRLQSMTKTETAWISRGYAE